MSARAMTPDEIEAMRGQIEAGCVPLMHHEVRSLLLTIDAQRKIMGDMQRWMDALASESRRFDEVVSLTGGDSER
jgi:hypothetical protein